MATLNSVKGNAQLQVVSPHYALLEGYDRFSRLPKQGGRKFRPLHRKKYGFLSPVGLFEQLSVLEWFTTPTGSEGVTSSPGYCIDKESTVLPTLPLLVVDRHQVGQREVFDLSVDGLHTFIAGTVGVHNCIGNSGPLIDKQSDAINSNGIAVASVLSGNRNYEARIHRDVRANYLMSPMLLIAYGIAGTVLKDLTSEPLAKNDRGEEVYLKDIWPTSNEIYEAVKKTVSTDLFEREYGSGISGVNPYWNSLDIPKGVEYAWNDKSTYIKLPPFFEGFNPKSPRRITGIYNARILAVFGDSVSTDHISPAGAIGKDSPAGRYLIEHGVNPQDFNTYGSRRGNHEVMMRGTFANNRIKNKIMNGKEGGYTMHFPDMKEMSIYETAMAYRKEGIPLVVLAGNEYGSGSSRDWAAKGPALLGVRAVVAKGFERIHRSNLIGMGVMPLQFSDGEDADSLEIDYTKPISISISEGMKPRDMIKMRYMKPDGAEHEARLVSRIDTDVEMEYYRAGGILNYVISNIFG
ncbi:MAG: aconitase family protein [Candidatus Marsarchaeota archaeon]|nr:aconitase family protein [Candidatus Marsarchaeota archaeon]MCL5413035.1 aconitase family protein [Candidatus Marsarchaeota archaeon]